MSELVIMEGVEWFEHRPDGLWHFEVKATQKGPRTDPSKLTSDPFEAIGRLAPIDGDNQRGLLVRFSGKEVTVPLVSISTGGDLARWLGDHGVRYDSRRLSLLLLYVNQSDARPIRAYTRNGWQKDGAFVAGENLIGCKVDARIMKTDTAISTFAAQGTFAEWRSAVLPLAALKPGWEFGLLAGLSSPLLRIVNASVNYGFNLTGRSSIGKTVALQAAANVWGRPDATGTLKSFNTTLNAIEGLAEAHNDLGLTLELKKSDPKVVQDSIYSLSNGHGKERMDSHSELKRKRHWLVNTLTSSEKSIEAMFQADGRRQQAGQVLRFVDIAAETLMPDLPVEQVHAFESALRSFYGVAGPEFVSRILARSEGAIVDQWQAATERLYTGPDNRVRRAAEGFALLVVAGEIMEIPTASVASAFGEWHASLGGALCDETQVAIEVHDFISRHMNATILPLEEEFDGEGDFEGGTGEAGNSYQKRDGWYRGGTVYLLTDTMAKLLDGHNRNTFYQWLRNKGIASGRNGRGMTVPIPKLAPPRNGVPIDFARLSALVDRESSI